MFRRNLKHSYHPSDVFAVLSGLSDVFINSCCKLKLDVVFAMIQDYSRTYKKLGFEILVEKLI